MPNRDGTGPQGNGPNTGRGNGPCKTDDDKADNTERRGQRRRRRSRKGRQ